MCSCISVPLTFTDVEPCCADAGVRQREWRKIISDSGAVESEDCLCVLFVEMSSTGYIINRQLDDVEGAVRGLPHRDGWSFFPRGGGEHEGEGSSEVYWLRSPVQILST
jgi:hypothetical protein